MRTGVDRVEHDGQILAIIIPAGYHRDGIEFFTPGEFSQQLAYMNRPTGYKVDPHVHNEVHREVEYTLEVLVVRKGRVRLDLYDNDRRFVTHRELGGGDIVLLASGGHGLEMLEPTEIVEIKQGPYAGDRDKTRFVPDSPRDGA